MSKTGLKPIVQVISEARRIWVGTGFHVSQMLSYNKVGQHMNPFLVLDYNTPMNVEPKGEARGITFHPHRGIETVTIAYDGGVTHCDSTGHSGTITKGGVQWMTAGSGILHEERHSDEFAKRGGNFEMVQMWMNLPQKDKLTKPKYQVHQSADLPKVRISDHSFVRVIAGSYRGFSSPITTFTKMNVWDLHLDSGEEFETSMPENYSAGLLIRKGLVEVNNSEQAQDVNLVVFERKGNKISIKSKARTDALLFFGEALEEPIAGKGPFVMNTDEEIKQAYKDYKTGQFGPVPEAQKF